MKYKINKNIPIPKINMSHRVRNIELKYPFLELKIGESFGVPINKEDSKLVSKRVWGAISNYKRRNSTIMKGLQFKMRTLPTEIRIWRTK